MSFYATCDATQLKWGLPPCQPLMLSIASFTAWRPNWRDTPALPSVPLDGHELAVDCGGFVAMKKGGYDYDLLAYLRWLDAVQPTWAALPDLCNEPEVAPTHADRRMRVFSSFIMGMMLWQQVQDTPWAWVPTVQGYTVDEYVESARHLASQVRWMRESYQLDGRWKGDPTAFDAWPDPYFRAMRQTYRRAAAPTDRHARGFRVGIGSLCVRKDAGWMERVDAIIEAVAAELPDVGFHLWGISLNYLKTRQGRLHPRVLSTDSSAFNGRFGSDITKQEARQARTCRECLLWMKHGILPKKCPMCGGSWGLGQRAFALRVKLPPYAATANRYLSSPRQSRFP